MFSYLLAYLIFSPLLAALFALCLKSGLKAFSILASFIVLVLNLKIAFDFSNGIDFEIAQNFLFLQNFSSLFLENSFPIFDPLGFRYWQFFSSHFGLDYFALLLMLLSSLMIFLSFIFLKNLQKSVVVAIFFLEFAIMGLFSAFDALLFYVFWELSLLPLIFIVGLYAKDYKIGIKFFIYAFAGSMLMLLAIIYMAFLNYTIENFWTFNLKIWQSNVLLIGLSDQIILFLAFFVAFAIKAPLFPLHTWAPKLYAHSPVFVSVILVAFKMAPFGFLRFSLPLFPDASVYLLPLIVALCIVSIVYSSFIAFKASDLRELIAYSSISHIGIMILGIFSFNSIGISGAVFYMFAHGIVTGALFLMAQSLEERYGTTELSFYHSLAKVAPVFSIFFALILLASISLPSTISFVGEFLVLLGIAKLNLLYAFLAGLVVILGAIYMLDVFRKAFFIQKESKIPSFSLCLGEKLSLGVIVILIFYLGLAPNVFLDPIKKESDNLLQVMKQSASNKESIDLLSGLRR